MIEDVLGCDLRVFRGLAQTRATEINDNVKVRESWFRLWLRIGSDQAQCCSRVATDEIQFRDFCLAMDTILTHYESTRTATQVVGHSKVQTVHRQKRHHCV